MINVSRASDGTLPSNERIAEIARFWEARRETRMMAYVANNIVIRDSSIPGAGRGVFSQVDLHPDPARRVAWYRGRIIPIDCWMNRSPELNSYIFYTYDGTFIDGGFEEESNWPRFLNCPKGSGKRPNVSFDGRGGIVVIREIKAGDELFVDYGLGYHFSNNRKHKVPSKAHCEICHWQQR